MMRNYFTKLYSSEKKNCVAKYNEKFYNKDLVGISRSVEEWRPELESIAERIQVFTN
jgi:hypothetical protein